VCGLRRGTSLADLRLSLGERCPGCLRLGQLVLILLLRDRARVSELLLTPDLRLPVVGVGLGARHSCLDVCDHGLVRQGRRLGIHHPQAGDFYLGRRLIERGPMVLVIRQVRDPRPELGLMRFLDGLVGLRAGLRRIELGDDLPGPHRVAGVEGRG